MAKKKMDMANMAKSYPKDSKKKPLSKFFGRVMMRSNLAHLEIQT